MRISDWSSDVCSSDLHYTKGTQSPHEGAPTACTHTVSGSISLPSPGFFSPFPHGTGSLSVGQEYLALEDGPPMFRQGFSCPALLTYHHTGPFEIGRAPSELQSLMRISYAVFCLKKKISTVSY